MILFSIYVLVDSFLRYYKWFRFQLFFIIQKLFVEIDHEIFSTVILSLPLIQEGQLLVSGERMCTILINCLED